jgi:hypothetical protein
MIIKREDYINGTAEIRSIQSTLPGESRTDKRAREIN